MVRQQELNDTFPLFAARELQLRDSAVLLVLIGVRDWRTGKSRISASAIASRLGVDPATCRASLARLKRHGLAVWVANYAEGENFYMVNPSLVFTGTPQQQAVIWERFRMAAEAAGG